MAFPYVTGGSLAPLKSVPFMGLDGGEGRSGEWVGWELKPVVWCASPVISVSMLVASQTSTS